MFFAVSLTMQAWLNCSTSSWDSAVEFASSSQGLEGETQEPRSEEMGTRGHGPEWGKRPWTLRSKPLSPSLSARTESRPLKHASPSLSPGLHSLINNRLLYVLCFSDQGWKVLVGVGPREIYKFAWMNHYSGGQGWQLFWCVHICVFKCRFLDRTFLLTSTPVYIRLCLACLMSMSNWTSQKWGVDRTSKSALPALTPISMNGASNLQRLWGPFGSTLSYSHVSWIQLQVCFRTSLRSQPLLTSQSAISLLRVNLYPMGCWHSLLADVPNSARSSVFNAQPRMIL